MKYKKLIFDLFYIAVVSDRMPAAQSLECFRRKFSRMECAIVILLFNVFCDLLFTRIVNLNVFLFQVKKKVGI